MFSIIYADPPWPYDNPQDHNPKRGGYKYPPMTMDEIKSLPVNQIANKDCALFLWATMPKLKQALETIDAWGFEYTTCAFVWVKVNPTGQVIELKGPNVMGHLVLEGGLYSGMGSWTNQNAELCLFAKKGRPKRKARNVKQVVVAPRGRHSAKPPEVRDRIVALLGDLPRIELFARERVDGWEAWGNEVTGEGLHKYLQVQ